MNTLIIGGGLSGLALADALNTKGDKFTLVEARDRLGGRIKSLDHAGAQFDLGPAWFWEGQPRIAALISRFGLNAFAQHTEGFTLFEDAKGQVHTLRGVNPMYGSMRIEGGMAALTHALTRGLPASSVHLETAISALALDDNGVVATSADGVRFAADRVVCALPPRLAAQIKCTPALPEGAVAAMQGVPTWMAGQAKVIAVYDTPFWREQGMSGYVTSRRGPMHEIHDASPLRGGPYALFGFIGIPPKARRDRDALDAHLRAQLGRVFGPRGADPAQLIVKDWATAPYTAARLDAQPMYAHPAYGMPAAVTALQKKKLYFCGSEVASEFGGYLEGALSAADDASIALAAADAQTSST
jgi:monoamine oxidase